MKKLFIIMSVVLFGLTSCNSLHKDEIGDNKNCGHWKVIEIDSCEYIFCCNSYHGFLAHKGNCKYCEERRKQREEASKK